MRTMTLRIMLGMLLVLVPVCGCGGDDGTSPPLLEPTQILLNPDVEAGADSPEHWTSAQEGPQPDNDYVFEWSEAEANSGSRSLMIQLNTVVDQTAFAHWSQSIDSGIPRGKRLVLEVVVKTILQGDGAGFMVRADDDSGPIGYATTQGEFSITGTRDWYAVSIVLEAVPEGTTSLHVFLMMFPGTRGAVYFDDIELTYNKPLATDAMPDFTTWRNRPVRPHDG